MADRVRIDVEHATKAGVRLCSSCLQPLVGYRRDAKVCRVRRCRAWAQRHPDTPHPSTRPRHCGCGQSIDHLNAKAKHCSKACEAGERRSRDVEAANAYARAWQQTDKAKAYQRSYRLAHADRRQMWARIARERNPERYRAYWQQWYSQNAHLNSARHGARRARILGNPDSVGVSFRDWRRLVARHRGCCAYCGQTAFPLHMDHVIPLSKGGRHAIGNVLPACSRCNLTKHAMLLIVWRRRMR